MQSLLFLKDHKTIPRCFFFFFFYNFDGKRVVRDGRGWSLRFLRKSKETRWRDPLWIGLKRGVKRLKQCTLEFLKLLRGKCYVFFLSLSSRRTFRLVSSNESILFLFCFHIDGRSSRRSRSGILANKNRIGDGDEILCRVKQRVREFIQEGKKGRFPFLGRRAIEDCIHGGGGLKRVLITIERRRRKIRKKGTKSLRTSAICTLERLLLPFLPCEGMEGKSKWKPRGRACSNCSTGPRQGLKLEEGETSGDSCIHEFRHWQITLTIRIPRIVRGLIRDVCVHPLPLIATSDYNGTVATWR